MTFATLAAAPAFAAPPTGVLDAAVGWMTGTLLGTVATSLCVLAIAVVGFSMLSGHLPVRRGMRVVLGCFLLLGAPVIAAGVGGVWTSAATPPPVVVYDSALDRRADLPPAPLPPPPPRAQPD